MTRGEEREGGFPKMETLAKEITINGNFLNSNLDFSLTITSLFGRRFSRTLYPRTLFTAYYNFHEENKIKLFPNKKSIQRPVTSTIKFDQN